MPYPLPLTRTEAYLAYKAGVIQQSDLKPSLAVPRNGIDAWLAYWTGLTKNYPVKGVGKNLFDIGTSLRDWFQTFHNGVDINSLDVYRATATIENNKLVIDSYDNTGWTWLSRWVSLEKNTEYVISGKNTQVIRIVGFNSKELFAKGTLIKIKNAALDGGTTTFNTGDYNYYAISFYPNGVSDYFEDIQIEKGSSGTAYEPYTGEPEMLTDEEAFIAYLSGVINEYPEKCLRRVGAYLRYLISARWGRPDQPLNREELYLSLIKTQVIPSGDPSSDITIEGTCKAPFVDVKMYGDTFQQSYTGKNLVATTRIAPQTQNGVTCTWDGASFTLNGTSTASTDFYGRGWWSATSDPIALPAGTYTLSMRKSDGSLATDADFSIDFWYGTTHIIGIYRGQSGAGYRTLTLDSDTQYSVIYISLQSGKTYNNEKFYVQLEKSESPTTYEPFVGGQPSPNPDYP